MRSAPPRRARRVRVVAFDVREHLPSFFFERPLGPGFDFLPGDEHAVGDVVAIHLVERGPRGQPVGRDAVGQKCPHPNEQRRRQCNTKPSADEVGPPRNRLHKHVTGPAPFEVGRHRRGGEENCDRPEQDRADQAAEGQEGLNLVSQRLLDRRLRQVGLQRERRQQQDEQHRNRPVPQRLVQARAGDRDDASQRRLGQRVDRQHPTKHRQTRHAQPGTDEQDAHHARQPGQRPTVEPVEWADEARVVFCSLSQPSDQHRSYRSDDKRDQPDCRTPDQKPHVGSGLASFGSRREGGHESRPFVVSPVRSDKTSESTSAGVGGGGAWDSSAGAGAGVS